VQLGLEPDRTLVLDLPVDVGLARARERADGGDRFEDETRHFFERVRERYLELTRAEPRRCRRIDAGAPADQVLAASLAALADLLPPGGGERA
jgi:dTMP kinase